MTLDPPVRSVLFDYGQTLMTVERPHAALQGAYDSIAAYLREHHGDAVPDGRRLLASVHDRLEDLLAEHLRSGALEELDLAGAAREAWEATGVPITEDQLDEVARREQEAWWEGIRLAPSAIDVLTELRRRGLRVGLCSNAPYRAASLRDQLDHLGLGQLLDSATFSGEVGWRKPSPAIFRAALADLGAKAATTAMVGDSGRADIEGGRGAGLRTVRIRQLRDDPPDIEADAVIDRLDELPDLLCRTEAR